MGAVLSKFIVFASLVKVKVDFEKNQQTKKSMQNFQFNSLINTTISHIFFQKSIGAI